MMTTHKTAVWLMVLGTLFVSAGQLILKLGINLVYSFMDIFNVYLLLGFLLYAVAGLLMIFSFKKGEMSVLYPIVATSYIWISVLSPILFPSDVMTVWKWAGVIVILFSVSVLGISSSRRTVTAHG